MLLNFLLYRPARSSCLSSLLGHMVSSTLPKGPTPSIARETPVVQPMPEKPSNVIILDLPALWRQDGAKTTVLLKAQFRHRGRRDVGRYGRVPATPPVASLSISRCKAA
ncbi:hypothetical protein [Sinorhizobium meliloti]|nr:hypothetical protein [Sinorhizobium meliloti]MDW9356984.1 hypothetical protein [Sinorhizobium meliloti]MDW9459943.1 hypothetical protein [Sinorhizobium meliloti]MDW9940853.1 hypothetical protein [Sinorhizobium meliloti]MDW9947097.1 hypothetical protein [Sinorhizobium meliloti]MDX0109933.1 hypothetical protein [Sinorhizobium meliloti]